MRIPQIFIPENKSLESSTNKLLDYNPTKESSVTQDYFNYFDIEPNIKYEWFGFDNSLKRLRKSGYERHLYPGEYFELVTGYMEERLENKLATICERLLATRGDWFSLAVKRENNNLTFYTDPKNLKWDAEACKYVTEDKLEYKIKLEFDASGLPPDGWVDLKELDDKLVKFLYNRKFEDLPPKMKDYELKIFFINDKSIWPLARADEHKMFCLYTGCTWGRPSRGIRQKLGNSK